MRFQFSDAERARRLAKLLKSTLSARGIEWPLHACREAVAEACGYASFHEVESSAGSATASPVDEAAEPTTVALRRARQGECLARRGIPAAQVDAVLDAVGLTRAFGPGRHGAVPVVPPPTARQARIAAMGGFGRSMRAGNYYACTLVSDGDLAGVVFGTDHSIEHDAYPDALSEALGIDADAATVSQARIPAPGADLLTFLDGIDGEATSLHLAAERDAPRDERVFGTDTFSNWYRETPWKYEGFKKVVPDLVTAWSYGRLTLVAYGDVARGRVRLLRDAILSGDAALGFSRATGPVLLLASRFDPDTPLDEAVAAAWEARETIAPGTPKGSRDATMAMPRPYRPASML